MTNKNKNSGNGNAGKKGNSVGKAKAKKGGGKTLAVTMIVKNESKVILRCLESLCDWIDYWVIHDTGSTDGTQDIIKNFMDEKGIPGELHQTPWKDFGYNRTLAIQSTQFKADYTLLCDADFILKVLDPDFKKKLNADGYLVKYEGHLDYRQNLLVNCKYKWKYVGVTHEYIHCPEAPNIIATDAIQFKHFADGGSRADKFDRDISLLLRGIEEEPDNSRYYFYLAQSYKDTEQYDEAITYYRKRVDFGGWGEEVYYSLYQLGMCKKRRGDSFWAFMGDLLRAYWYRPERLEALHQLVSYCRMNGYPQLGYQLGKLAIHNEYPKDMLFIEKPVHDWLFESEVALCAYMCGKFKQAVMINDKILKAGTIYHEGEQARLEKNQEFFKKAYEEFLKKGGKNVIKKVPNLPLGTRGMNLNAQRTQITPEKISALRQLQEKMKDAQDVSVVVHVNTVRPNLEKLMVALASQTVKPAQLYIILGSKVTLTPEITELLSKYKHVFPQMNPIKIQSNGVDYDGRLKFLNSVSAKHIVIYDESRIPAPRNIEYYLKLSEQYPDVVGKGIFGQWGWQLHAPTYNEDKEIVSQWEMAPFISQSEFLSTDQHCGDLKQVDYLCGHWFGLTANFAKLAQMHDKHELRLEHWKEDILFSFVGQLKMNLKTYKCCPRDGLATCIYDPADVQSEVGPDELSRRSDMIKDFCLEGYQMAVAQPGGVTVIGTNAEKMTLSGESVSVIKKGDGTILSTQNITDEDKEMLLSNRQMAEKSSENKVDSNNGNDSKASNMEGGLFSVSDGLKKAKKIDKTTAFGGKDQASSDSLYGEGGIFSVTSKNQAERDDTGKPVKRNVRFAENPVILTEKKVEPPKKLDFSPEGLFSVSKGLKKMIKQPETSGEEKVVEQEPEVIKEEPVESDSLVVESDSPVVESDSPVVESDSLVVESDSPVVVGRRLAIFVPDYTSMGGSEITVKTLFDKLVAWNQEQKMGHQIIITNDVREAVAFRPDVMISQQRAVGLATQICLQMGIRLWILIHGPRQFVPSPALELLVYNSKHLMESEGSGVQKFGDNPKLMYYHPAIDINRYRIGELGQVERRYVTFVGSSGYNYLKGCDLFIELARAMPKQKFLYVGPVEKIDYQRKNYQLVGQMPDLLDKNGKSIEPDHLAQQEKGELPSNLEILANTPRVEQIYAQSKVLVVPSLVESFGRVAVEGAAAGVPVVASNLAGLKEATNSLAMYVEKYRHVGEYKKAVEEVLAWHEEYGEKCEEIVTSYEEGVRSSFEQLVGFL